jgi:hypothetical protein
LFEVRTLRLRVCKFAFCRFRQFFLQNKNQEKKREGLFKKSIFCILLRSVRFLYLIKYNVIIFKVQRRTGQSATASTASLNLFNSYSLCQQQQQHAAQTSAAAKANLFIDTSRRRRQHQGYAVQPPTPSFSRWCGAVNNTLVVFKCQKTSTATTARRQWGDETEQICRTSSTTAAATTVIAASREKG